MNVTSDVDVQKRGLVYIAHLDNHHHHNHQATITDQQQQQSASSTSSSSMIIDYEFMRRGLKMPHIMPLRYVATYIVLNTDHDTPENNGENQQHHNHPSLSLWDNLIDFMYLIANPFLRVRTRSIRGSYQECQYKLMCLGIPHDAIPVKEDGTTIVKTAASSSSTSAVNNNINDNQKDDDSSLWQQQQQPKKRSLDDMMDLS